MIPDQVGSGNVKNMKNNYKENKEIIILGGGCFWCLEAVYLRVSGVVEVVSGYAGGNIINPSYEQVSSGKTGHAEVVKIIFDSSEISLENILKIFFTVHDPTAINRQGNDVGEQYRSVVFFENEQQKNITKKVIVELEGTKIYDGKIMTEIKKLENFFEAESYHQKYFEKNPEQAYCQIVIAPKVSKFREKFEQFYKKDLH